MKRLSEDEIVEGLRKLHGWTREGEKIKRTLKFGSFMKAIDFINRIARHAEEADHHPEIFNVYDKVELELTTHDADGLTRKDFDLAALIDQVGPTHPCAKKKDLQKVSEVGSKDLKRSP